MLPAAGQDELAFNLLPKQSHSCSPFYLKPLLCSSGGIMVGRNSSMLLMAFCMTTSNTHSRGRHSSSISWVDDAGKYLGIHENTRWARTDKSANRCRQARTDWRYKHEHWSTVQRSKRRIIQRVNYTITEDETYSLQLLIKAFKMWSTELQTGRQKKCVSASFWMGSTLPLVSFPPQ